MKIFSKNLYGIIFIILLSCFAMYFVENSLLFNYMNKTFFKIVLFLFLPLLYVFFDRSISIRDYFKIKSKKDILYSLLLALAVYILILSGFFIFKPFIDLNSISNSLTTNLNINKGNFIFVALYISFVNSLLEEFFFRGFTFLSLRKLSNNTFAYIFSPLAFSLYHIAIISSWFNIFIFIFILISLFIAGLLFNFLNSKSNNIYNSWLVHMFANFGINTVGIIMFYF